VDWYQRYLAGTGRAPAVWMLIGFLVTFAVTRGITRRIHAKAARGPGQPGPPGPGRGGLSDIYIGGVHVHHQVWGIVLVLAAGLLQFRYSPRPPLPHHRPPGGSRKASYAAPRCPAGRVPSPP